jgi:transposase
MSKQKRYSPELRERAVRMVLDHVDEYPTEWAAIVSVAEKTGPSAQTLQNWLKAYRLANGTADAATVEKAQAEELARKNKDLEREVRDLRRANDILKAASVFFATELDGQTKK